MTYYLVTGRIDGDDEDTAAVYETDNEDQAREAFKADSASQLFDKARTDLIYITTVAWSNSPIHIS